MATRLCEKRMAKERKELEAEATNYFAIFKDDDLLNFDAYVVGPEGTPYEHKFVKVHLEIPNQYPMVPPKVKFIQHTGDRIHPNLYVEGKVCLSILGTWSGPGWAFGMTCHTVLITIRSLLDSRPYMHEPNQPDNPNFTKYVQYATWKCLLLDYVERAENEKARNWLEDQIHMQRDSIRAALRIQQTVNATLSVFQSPYNRGRGTLQMSRPDYAGLIVKLEGCVASASAAVAARTATREEEERQKQCEKQRLESELANQKFLDNKRSFEDVVDLTEDTDVNPSSRRKKRVGEVAEVIDLT